MFLHKLLSVLQIAVSIIMPLRTLSLAPLPISSVLKLMLKFLLILPLRTMYLYAEDILLLHQISHPTHVISLNLCPNGISSWLSKKSLSINISKSKYVYFSFLSLPFDTFPPVTIMEIELERVYWQRIWDYCLHEEICGITVHMVILTEEVKGCFDESYDISVHNAISLSPVFMMSGGSPFLYLRWF